MTTLETSRAQLLEAFAEGDIHEAHAVAEPFRTKHGIESMVIDLALPVTTRLSRLWAQGSFGVLHERRVIQMVQELTRAWLPLDSYPPTRRTVTERPVVLAGPPPEVNDIQQRLFAVILQHRGIPTASLGGAVPWHAVTDAVRNFNARGCIVFVRDIPTIAGRQPILRHLAQRLPTYLFPTAEAVVETRGIVTLPGNWWNAARLVTEDASLPAREQQCPG